MSPVIDFSPSARYDLRACRHDPRHYQWTTADNVTLFVCRMSDSHLENSYRLMSRVSLAYTGLPYPQGEHAQDAFEHEVRQIEAIEDELLREIERRHGSERKRKVVLADPALRSLVDYLNRPVPYYAPEEASLDLLPRIKL